MYPPEKTDHHFPDSFSARTDHQPGLEQLKIASKVKISSKNGLASYKKEPGSIMIP